MENFLKIDKQGGGASIRAPESRISSFILQDEDMQQQIIRETFHLVSKRDDAVCNFLEGGT